MKNRQKNIENLKKMKNILALVSTVACATSFGGCTNEGWESDNHKTVQNQVSSHVEYIIENVFTQNFTFDSAKAALEKKGLNLTNEQIKQYLEDFKGANPENNSEYIMQKGIEDYQKSLKKSDVVEPSYEVVYTYTKNRKYYD